MLNTSSQRQLREKLVLYEVRGLTTKKDMAYIITGISQSANAAQRRVILKAQMSAPSVASCLESVHQNHSRHLVAELLHGRNDAYISIVRNSSVSNQTTKSVLQVIMERKRLSANKRTAYLGLESRLLPTALRTTERFQNALACRYLFNNAMIQVLLYRNTRKHQKH